MLLIKSIKRLVHLSCIVILLDYSNNVSTRTKMPIIRITIFPIIPNIELGLYSKSPPLDSNIELVNNPTMAQVISITPTHIPSKNIHIPIDIKPIKYNSIIIAIIE